MKKIFSILLCLLLLLPITVRAEHTRVVDDANLLSADEVASLEKYVGTIVQKYGMDVVILTVDSINGMQIFDYADDYYDSNGYGIGSSQSGIVFILSMSEREWAIRTIGEAKKAVTDYEIDDITDLIWNDLSSGNYYETFDVFLSCVEVEYDDYQNSNHVNDNPEYDFTPDDDISIPDNESHSPGLQSVLNRLAIALLIGAVVALIALLIMRSQMNTARRQSGAGSYMVSGSYDLFRCQDFFLYSRTSRTRKAESSSSSGSRSGGSRGGRSGRF